MEIEARNDTRIQEMHLNNLLGQSTTTSIELASNPGESGEANVDGDQPTVDRLLETAERQRADLEAASARVRAAEATVGAASGGWWPQIELSANYLYNNPNSRYQPLTPEFLGSWDVGVSMSLDLWNWGATGSKVEQAKAHLRQAELNYTQLRETIVLDVNRALLNLERSKEKRKVAQLAISQAHENLRTTAEKYRAGLATSTDLLDAEVSLLQAQTQLSGVEVELALARAGLKRAVGELVQRAVQ
jgi:outer membrane protein TolC